jgi:hypothetical protein
MNEYERNVLSNIEEHGCSVTSVFDPDENEPPFSYSIGITKSCGSPELIVFGLKSNISHWLINEYRRRVGAGEQFVPGVLYLGFLDGFAVRFANVPVESRDKYMRSTCWLYSGTEFEALQLIWPGTDGIWPWQPEANNWMKFNQPVLCGDIT